MSNTITELTQLFFSEPQKLGQFEPVVAGDLPAAYQSLLAHHDHMTVTLEAWHNSLVDVLVLDEKIEQDSYARKIVLARQRDAVPVQYGFMRISLAGLPDIVRMEIESQALPLGRIMIRHHLMREVELCQLWRVTPGDELQASLQLEGDTPIYGRSARILVDGQQAVELLEIVRA